MRYATPRQTDDRLNSTNGFTIGKRYAIIYENQFGSATVINDNGHERVIGTDGGSNAHLQRRGGSGYNSYAHCAGYFEITDSEDGGPEVACPDCEGHGANYDRNEVLVPCERCDSTGTIGVTT